MCEINSTENSARNDEVHFNMKSGDAHVHTSIYPMWSQVEIIYKSFVFLKEGDAKMLPLTCLISTHWCDLSL